MPDSSAEKSRQGRQRYIETESCAVSIGVVILIGARVQSSQVAAKSPLDDYCFYFLAAEVSDARRQCAAGIRSGARVANSRQMPLAGGAEVAADVGVTAWSRGIQ